MNYFRKSGRQGFGKLLVSGLLYMLFANILCTVMTVSTAPFIGNDFMKVIIFILAVFVFYSLMFTVAYKDGDNEQRYVRLHKEEPPSDYKWVKIGAVMTAVMCLPSLILFIGKVSGWFFDLTLVHRIIDGMVYALSLIIVPDSSIDSMPLFAPFIYMLCYALIPVATHIGFYFGYTGKFDKDKMMYE